MHKIKTLTIKCPICNKPMVYVIGLITSYNVKPKRLADRKLFYCKNKKCIEYKNPRKDERIIFYTFDNKDNYNN